MSNKEHAENAYESIQNTPKNVLLYYSDTDSDELPDIADECIEHLKEAIDELEQID